MQELGGTKKREEKNIIKQIITIHIRPVTDEFSESKFKAEEKEFLTWLKRDQKRRVEKREMSQREIPELEERGDFWEQLNTYIYGGNGTGIRKIYTH